MNKTFLAMAASVAVLALGAARAEAAVIGYTLQGVTFIDGAVATGTVTYDLVSDFVSGVDISVTAGDLFPAAHYGDGSDIVGHGLPLDGKEFATFDFSGPNPNRLLVMAFFESLGIAETHLIDLSNSHECYNCSPFRLITGGSLVLTNPPPPPTVGGVPEPATWSLMIAGFGLSGAALRRRRRVLA